ncbi:MAG: N-formimino-L-glutamate deiminase, partial [Actinotalea sp.]|nr:N-formimino-L-glutamate deiminase [Actinotalea sp.]
MSRSWWCAAAWLPDGIAERVRITADDGVITGVETGADPTERDTLLPGVVLPGFANAHSHAFHRALRGHTHTAGGDFWSWREAMYALAGALDPDSCFEIARAVYMEMVLAGVTAVGEFHYVHHPSGGGGYDDPNAMGHALQAAAREAGLRLTLLDTCYLTSGIGHPAEGVAARFSDGTADAWAERVSLLRETPGFRVGAAVHSVRAVPPDAVATVARWARSRDAPLHVHLSEQAAENAACRSAYGRSPTEVLDDAGALGHDSTAVHAVHVTDGDVERLGSSGTSS